MKQYDAARSDSYPITTSPWPPAAPRTPARRRWRPRLFRARVGGKLGGDARHRAKSHRPKTIYDLIIKN